MEPEKNSMEDVKSRDMASMSREAAPKKTWFFQRGDGMVFACEEHEAWDVVNNKSEWKRRDFRLLGVSDGTTYAKMVKESIVKAKVLEPELTAMENEIMRFQKAEENLLTSEAVDMDDLEDPVNAANIAKVMRLRKIIEKQRSKLEEKKDTYRKLVSDVVKRATEAELEVARGNIEWPGAVNIITPNASPQERKKILNIMEGRN